MIKRATTKYDIIKIIEVKEYSRCISAYMYVNCYGVKTYLLKDFLPEEWEAVQREMCFMAERI